MPRRYVNRNKVPMVPVTITIPEAHHKALKDLAAREDVTYSAIVRALIKARVEHIK